MKRVLHILKEYRGNYPLLNEYIKALPPDRYRSTVCYLSGRPDGRNELHHIASDVKYLQFGKRYLKYFLPVVISRLCDIIKSEQVQIIHCHRHRATVIGTMAAGFCGKPCVISHVHGLSRTRSKKRYLTNWVLLRKVARIIAVSDSVRLDVLNTNRALPPDKVVTVRNGLNISSIDGVNITRDEVRMRLGITGNETVFGTVGRLTPTKGQSYLIEAFAEVVGKIPASRLVIVGDGPLYGKLQKQVEDLNLWTKVFFTGYRNDVRELLRGFDVFILPSIAEGLSIALLEAMASRLPVVASRVGGIPEVLDSDCGRLVPARDPGSLARVMEELAGLDEKQQSLLGNSARKKVETSFTTEAMQKGIRAVYDSL
jgi:glycosyltransferase involved in cell wall biosynthesis